MQWSDLLGHEQQKEWFRTALAGARLGTSFLFVGPEGIGKRTFARLLAKGLLCRGSPPDSLEPCGHCEDCAQVDAATHPDLILVSKPADKAFIPVELLIGERDKRMREGLCHDISLRPYGNRRKIAILDDADYFNTEGANCLLKTLEEPPVDSVLILVGSSLQRQLSTIRSRCQAIIFRPLSDENLLTLLMRHEITPSREEAQQLVRRCEGSLAEAQLLADPQMQEFRSHLLQMLSNSRLPMLELSKTCSTMVDAAGKDPRAKRERLKLLLRLAARFYRAIALSQENSDASRLGADEELVAAAQQSLRHWATGMAGATAAWGCCLAAIEDVDRNANQASLLECWVTDVARLSGC